MSNDGAQEANSEIIELHDDDPVYFEVLLRYLYEHKWNTTVANRKVHDYSPDTFPAKAFTPIGVYALADKYEVEELKACAVGQLPDPRLRDSRAYAPGVSQSEQSCDVLEAHYSHCISPNCAMGRRLCHIVIRRRDGVAKEKGIEDLAVKYPALAADMYFAARENGGKIW